MSDDTNHKEPASDTTSPAAPRNLSEAEFLSREAAQAREAVTGTLDSMRETARSTLDVGAWTRRFPWTSLGVAAAAGFVATAALVGRRKRKRSEPPEHDPTLMERILSDEQIATRLRELAAEEKNPPKRDRALADTLGILFKTFGPVLQSTLASALAAKAASEAAEQAATENDELAAEDETQDAS